MFSQSLIPFRNSSPQITSTKHITQITPDLSTKSSHLTYFLDIQYGEDIIFFGITNYHWQNKWHKKFRLPNLSISQGSYTLLRCILLLEPVALNKNQHFGPLLFPTSHISPITFGKFYLSFTYC